VNLPLRISIAVFGAAGLAACGSSSAPAAAADPPAVTCSAPLPAATLDAVITVDVPTDFDPAVNPAPATQVPLTVHMPARCPGQTFPLILYGHGFGESRAFQGSDLIDDGNPQPLLDRGYVEIKVDQRGHGDNRPPKGGGYARFVDPRAEIRDAQAILDWAYDHAAQIGVQTEPDSGIPRDLKVGTLGGSYGGGFQLLLAALDPRIDAIAPDRTWHELAYSFVPGDALKAFPRLIGLLIQLDEAAPGQGVTTSPWGETFVNQIGPLALDANLVRTRADIAAAVTAPLALPRPLGPQELDDDLRIRAMDYFEARQAAGKPWGLGETQARLRPVPALFSQGQRDVLFNTTEAYWNARYFAAAGAPVRVLTHEDGHMNPLAGQSRGLWACGRHDVQAAILAWFDRWLKHQDSAAFESIPAVCISLLDSQDKTAQPVGVELAQYPVGSLSGAGAEPVLVPTVSASVPAGSGATPVFAPLVTIHGDGQVLAGIPRIAHLSVAPGTPLLQTAIAIVGIGLRRGGQLRLVDDQVTAFVAGEHDGNRGVQHPGEGVLLPGLGEQLRDGDELGLLLYEQNSQYAPVVTAQNIPNLTTVLPGVPVTLPQPITSALNPALGLVNVPNPYTLTASGVELPVFTPGVYSGSRWSR